MRPSEARRRLQVIVDKDPAALHKLGKFTKSGRINPWYNHQIYILLVIIPLLTILSALFYCLAELDSLIGGTPEDEVNDIIERRLRNIIIELETNETQKMNSRLNEL